MSEIWAKNVQVIFSLVLKVVFFVDVDENVPVIITAYEPNNDEVKLYEKIQRQKKR